MYLNGSYNFNECFGLVKSKKSINDIKHEVHPISSLSIKGKTIIVLCGNNTKNPEKASSYATTCINWLDGCTNQQDVTVYSIFYPKNQPLHTGLILNRTFNYDQLAQTIFEQLFFKNGELLSTAQIMENLGNVTFFGHSIGGHVMNELMYSLEKAMKRFNFTLPEITRIFSSIVFIGYSPFKLVDYPTKNIYIAPLYDSAGSAKLCIDKMKRKRILFSSNPNFNLEEMHNLKADSHFNYIKQIKAYTNNDNIVYLMNNNTIVAIPNLLFDDGKQEDHNLAGVIPRHDSNSYKTHAGEITTNFMSYLLELSVFENRKKLDISNLYDEILYFNQISNTKGATNG